MSTSHTNRAVSVERLEGRRLLCGDLVDAAVSHVSDGADSHAAAVADTPNKGHVIAAFAQGRGMHGGEVVWGETTVINGATVATWAIMSKTGGSVLAAGLTMPLALSEDQPQQGGSGPARAIASLRFPAVVQQATFFNHLELHTQPNGHPITPLAADPNRYRAPHFDFHFYRLTEEQVRAIPFAPPGPQVPANRLPAGYAQPGPSEPEMGRHAPLLTELSAQGLFSKVMVAGFTPDSSQMHLIEPMVTAATLLEKKDFSLEVPMPQTFDFDALYPTRFEAVFQGDAHHFIFSDFIDTNPATPVGVAVTRGVSVPAAPHGLFSDSESNPSEEDQRAIDELLD